MTDYTFHRELPRTEIDPWASIQAADLERQSQPLWKDLLPDIIEAAATDGQEVRFDSVDDLGAWIGRRSPTAIRSVFVRWTEHGRAAGPGMLRIALRVGRSGEMWVGGQDETSALGMTNLLESAIMRVGISPEVEPDARRPEVIPDTRQSDEKFVSALRVERFPTPAAPIGPSRKWHENGWVVGIGVTVIGGLILAGILWAVASALAS